MIPYIPFIGVAILLLLWKNPVMRFQSRGVIPTLIIRGLMLVGWGIILLSVFRYSEVSVNIADAGVEPWRIIASGLEDALFVLPAFIIPKSKWRLAFLAYSTVVFCIGHEYQGFYYAAAKAPFVIISYALAERYGILTTIMAHSLNDVLAFSATALLMRGRALWPFTRTRS